MFHAELSRVLQAPDPAAVTSVSVSNCQSVIDSESGPRGTQYTRFFGGMTSTSSVSVYMWTGR